MAMATDWHKNRKTEESMPGGRGEVYKALHWLNDGMEAGADWIEGGVADAWNGGKAAWETGSDYVEQGWDAATGYAEQGWDAVSDFGGDLLSGDLFEDLF
jgi:hypothetical protein